MSVLQPFAHRSDPSWHRRGHVRFRTACWRVGDRGRRPATASCGGVPRRPCLARLSRHVWSDVGAARCRPTEYGVWVLWLERRSALARVSSHRRKQGGDRGKRDSRLAIRWRRSDACRDSDRLRGRWPDENRSPGGSAGPSHKPAQCAPPVRVLRMGRRTIGSATWE